MRCVRGHPSLRSVAECRNLDFISSANKDIARSRIIGFDSNSHQLLGKMGRCRDTNALTQILAAYLYFERENATVVKNLII